jgi:Mitochondrial carrier protein
VLYGILSVVQAGRTLPVVGVIIVPRGLLPYGPAYDYISVSPSLYTILIFKPDKDFTRLSYMSCSTVRDMSGTALYFFEYDCMRHLLGRLPNGEQGPTPYWAPLPPSVIPFVCGSLAGVSSWAIIYPLDVVKTKTQQRALSGEMYRGPLETLGRLLRGRYLAVLFFSFSFPQSPLLSLSLDLSMLLPLKSILASCIIVVDELVLLL